MYKTLQMLLVSFFLFLSVVSNAAGLDAQTIANLSSLPANEQQKLIEQYQKEKGGTNPVSEAVSVQTVPAVPPQAVGQDQKAVASKSAGLPKNGSLLEKQYRQRYQSSMAENVKQFGYNLFTESSAISPTKVVPNNDYLITAGDQIRIRLWGALEDIQYVATVENDGTINVPKIGVVNVLGSRLGQLDAIIGSEINKYIQGVQVDIALENLHSVEIYVVGEVASPGLHMVPAFSTIFKGLQAAGGVNKSGSLRRVTIHRQGQKDGHLDLYSLLLSGKRDADQVLQDGDVLFVPRIGTTVAVVGAVYQPGVFELNSAETVADVLTFAGGVLPNASTKTLYVKYYDERNVFQVEDIRSNSSAASQRKLYPGSVLEIPFIPEDSPDAVRLTGHIKVAQTFTYNPGMMLKDVLRSVEELKPDTFFDYALLYRYDPSVNQRSLQKFPLQDFFNGKFQLHLQPYDRIEILSLDQQNVDQHVSISGSVRVPRSFPYADQMQLSDILASVDELKPESLLDYALLHRYNANTTRYEVQKFALSDFFAGKSNLRLQPRDRVEILSRAQLGIVENISVSGAVWQPGSFTFYPGMNVLDALALAGGINEQDYIADSAYLYRYDSQLLQFTIEKLSLDATNDPIVLKPSDRISLLSRSDYNFNEPVHIAGAVRKGGEFTWHPEMNVQNLIDLAGGTYFGARSDRIEISRITIADGRSDVHHLQLNLDTQQNLTLQPYDYVFVPRVKDATRVATVQLNGEVRYPGTYSIAEGERLSQVVERAGGFTDQAYYYGAIFTSPQAQKIQQSSIDKMLNTLRIESQRSAVDIAQTATSKEELMSAQGTSEVTQDLLNQLSAIKAKGRISISLSPLSSFAGSDFDLELQDGDSLNVPTKPSFVTVVGSVYSPNSYLYRPGLTVADYLAKSGGPTKKADEDYIYIQRVNGEVFSVQQAGMFNRFYNQELMPGDTVVVLEDLERIPALRLFKDITEIVFRIATTAGIAFAI